MNMNEFEDLIISYINNNNKISYTFLSDFIINNLNQNNLNYFLESLYLSSFLNNNKFSSIIRYIIENFNYEEILKLINENKYIKFIFISSFTYYILSLNKYPNFKNFLIEIALLIGNKVTLEKLNIIKISSLNEILRNILIEYYLELYDMGFEDFEIYEMFDSYFYNSSISPSIKNKYQEFINNENIIKQIRILYQILFLYCKDNHIKDELFDFLNECIKNNYYTLPEDDFLRYRLYSSFFAYILTSNLSKSITNLKKEDYALIKKINPLIKYEIL